MHKIKVHCEWDLDVDFFHEKQIELFVDTFVGFNQYSDTIKILYLCEPDAISHLAHSTVKNKFLFDYILTFDENVLNNCENAHLFEFGTSWIKDYEFKEKKYGVSTIVGFKKITKGHLLRQKVYYKQDKINIPKQIFLSKHHQGMEIFKNNSILGESKNPLFDYQFHIVIENVSQNYYFSEKLLDCFRTKTIPIYWGCKNINKYFDVNGIILFEDFKDLINKVNSIKEDNYNRMKDSVEKNYVLSEKFLNLGERMKNMLEQIII